MVGKPSEGTVEMGVIGENMRRLTFENETHWRTTDIQRIVRLAMAEADTGMSEPRVVRVLFPKKPRSTKATKGGVKQKRRKPNGIITNPSVANVVFRTKTLLKDALRVNGEEKTTEIIIYLPRRGAKDPHPVAMVALAANRAVAGKVSEDDTLLPFSDVYFIANYLVYHFASEAWQLYEDETGKLKEKWESLRQFYRETTPPEWGDPSKLFIAKYRDPLKDATFLAFLRKKRKAIKVETTRIATEKKAVAAAQKRLKDAEKRKKAAEKAITDATERRKVSS